MSLYQEYESTASVYHYTDSNTTKKSAKGSVPTFTINLFIIERSELDASIGGEESGDYVCNVDATYSNAGNFRTGDVITWNSKSFEVVNKPKYNYLFDQYKLILRRIS